MPVHRTHPDPEELAAWQAGDLPGPDGARIEAHVSGCGDCAALVAAVERGRAALAGLTEVEPPAGLHQRLAAAIEREATAPAPGDGARDRLAAAGFDDRQRRRAATAADGEGPGESGIVPDPGEPRTVPEPGESGIVPEPIPLDGRRLQRRSPAGRRRLALLSTAAALILLVVGLVPLLRHGGGQTLATQGGGRGPETASRALGGSAQGALPVFSAPDGYSGRALQAALASNSEVRLAYERAAGGTAGSRTSPSSGQPSPAAPQLGAQGESGGAAKGAGGTASTSGGEGAGGRTAGNQAPSGLQQDTCVTSARTRASDQGLQPAFFVNPTVYQGRAATVLVTVRPGAPDQADLWAFPLGNCSAPPFAHDRVTVTPP